MLPAVDEGLFQEEGRGGGRRGVRGLDQVAQDTCELEGVVEGLGQLCLDILTGHFESISEN